jgi:ADP-ribose pyrophosphatase YjhB (NUDIX family)
MNFCNLCGHGVELRVPERDNRTRWCCPHCHMIHYENPRMVLGTIPVWDDQILLCKRAIEPRLGYWTLPAGFLENGESTADGALRETMEEAGANIALEGAFSIYDVLHVHQVHMFYRARLLDLDFSAGPESLEVRLFKESEIPWEDIAFKTVAMTLRAFFEDRARGHFSLRTGPVDRVEKSV